MPIFGDFKKNGENYEGSMRTLGVDTDITFEAVDRTHEKQPTHRAYVGDSEIGAGWEKVSEKGNVYLSYEIDDPSFAKPMNGALVQRSDGDYSMVWDRPKEPKPELSRADRREQRLEESKRKVAPSMA